MTVSVQRAEGTTKLPRHSSSLPFQVLCDCCAPTENSRTAKCVVRSCRSWKSQRGGTNSSAEPTRRPGGNCGGRFGRRSDSEARIRNKTEQCLGVIHFVGFMWYVLRTNLGNEGKGA